jgi:hypothetical protein
MRQLHELGGPALGEPSDVAREVLRPSYFSVAAHRGGKRLGAAGIKSPFG